MREEKQKRWVPPGGLKLRNKAKEVIFYQQLGIAKCTGRRISCAF